MRVEKIVVRHVKMDLSAPYHLSYRTFTAFEPYVVEVVGSNGISGWGDGHISPGSSKETREGGWTYCQKLAPQLLGLSLEEALAHVTPTLNESKVAGSAFCLALEMLQESPILTIETPSILPLLTPINALRENEIEAEIEKKLVQGFRTFKIKVGKDVKADLERVAAIQQIVGKRATLRVDANRAYTREEGVLFASSLNPHALELFEQPCDADDWEANAEVASVSNVPMMLDEPICSIEDISRAAEIKGVGFCKLKLKRFGTLRGLFEGLEYVRSCGMEPVLGDGLGSELTSWMEACVASKTIRNAGEFNGFLKPRERLFDNPLQFEKGNLILPRGYQPSLNLGRIGSFTCNTMTFDS